jgi:hypothetical protein
MKKYFTISKQTLVTTYVGLGRKLLGSVLNHTNQFARHLIEVQGKNPDYVAPPPSKEASYIRPSFRFDESRSWTKAHFKKPLLKHPILVGRTKLEFEGGLRDKAAEQLAAEATKSVAQVEVLQRTIPQPDPIEDLRKAFATLTFSDKKVEDVEMEVTSGSRAVSKEKAAAKRATPKKKVVRIKKTKRGSVHRVED